MVDETIRLLGLNLGPLVRHRVEMLSKAAGWQKNGQQAEARAAASRFSPNSVAVRVFLAKKRKDWLPSEDEETLHLVRDLHWRLSHAARHGPADVAARLLFALGALLAARGPVVSSYFIGRPRLLSQVQLKADELTAG